MTCGGDQMRDLERERFIYLLEQVSPSQRWRFGWSFRLVVIQSAVRRRDFRAIWSILGTVPGAIWHGIQLLMRCS